MASETENGQTTTFQHDRNSQLTDATGGARPDEAFGYDANGNRTGSGIVVGPDNQIIQDSQFVYSYDNEGNLIRKTEIATGNVTRYTYDYRNRLTDMVQTDSSIAVLHEAHYTYDVFDRRIARRGRRDDSNECTMETMRGLTSTRAELLTARYPGAGIDELVARFRPGEGVSWYLTTILAAFDHRQRGWGRRRSDRVRRLRQRRR